MLDQPPSQCRDAAAMSNTNTNRSQRKRPDWNDYFLQRSEHNSVRGQQRAMPSKDIESFQYVGRELEGPNDFQSAEATMKKSEVTRMINDNNRALRPHEFNNTYMSRVPLGSSLLRDRAAPNGTTGAEQCQRLFQSKIPSECTPANVYNPQSWQDLISRTLNANDLVKGGAIHPVRKQQESLKQTKKVLEPHLQDEVNVMGNKITGCKKKVLSSGVQTYQLGQQYEQV